MSKISTVRENVVNALKNEVATITFTKKDGSERVMKGTLMPTLLPEFTSDKPKKERKVNEEVVAVFDIEANGFRSFRLDTVTSFVTDTMVAGKLL